MTQERTKLIEKYEKWFATNPNPNIIAAECANIAEDFAEEAKRKLPMAIVVRRNAKLMDYENFVSWYNEATGRVKSNQINTDFKKNENWTVWVTLNDDDETTEVEYVAIPDDIISPKKRGEVIKAYLKAKYGENGWLAYKETLGDKKEGHK